MLWKMYIYTIYMYNEKYFSDNHFSYIHVIRVLTWRAWRRIQLPVAIAKIVMDTNLRRAQLL
jgi:hypothetical protein